MQNISMDRPTSTKADHNTRLIIYLNVDIFANPLCLFDKLLCRKFPAEQFATRGYLMNSIVLQYIDLPMIGAFFPPLFARSASGHFKYPD